MSLKKDNSLVIVSCIIILFVLSVIFLVPSIREDIITGLASIAGFNVSVSVIHVSFDINNREQLDPVIVNGTNITIKMPLTYYDNISMNLTTNKPAGFECGSDWYINESGSIKSVSVNGSAISWQADKSVKNTYLYFEVPPPTITSEVTYTGDSYYEKTIVIDSCCPLINVSANISVSTNYEDYILYLIENNTLINRTDEYHLQVSNGRAYFYDFNLSNNKTFRIQAAPNATLVERVVRRGGGGGGGGGSALPLLNYTPTQQFFVEPNHINIITSEPAPLDLSIKIYNLKGTEKTFNISFTTNFVYDMISSITIPHKDFVEVPVHIDTTGLKPGNYTDYVSVRSDGDEEKVIITLNLLETEVGVEGAEEKTPAKEQPRQIIGEEQKEGVIRGKKVKNTLRVVLLVISGLLLMAAIVFLHLGRRTKIVRY